jgi:hypothetical protein
MANAGQELGRVVARMNQDIKAVKNLGKKYINTDASRIAYKQILQDITNLSKIKTSLTDAQQKEANNYIKSLTKYTSKAIKEKNAAVASAAGGGGAVANNGQKSILQQAQQGEEVINEQPVATGPNASLLGVTSNNSTIVRTGGGSDSSVAASVAAAGGGGGISNQSVAAATSSRSTDARARAAAAANKQAKENAEEERAAAAAEQARLAAKTAKKTAAVEQRTQKLAQNQATLIQLTDEYNHYNTEFGTQSASIDEAFRSVDSVKSSLNNIVTLMPQEAMNITINTITRFFKHALDAKNSYLQNIDTVKKSLGDLNTLLTTLKTLEDTVEENIKSADSNNNRANSIEGFEQLGNNIKILIHNMTEKIESYTAQNNTLNNESTLNTILAKYKGLLKLSVAQYNLGLIRAEFTNLININITRMNSNNKIKSMVDQHKGMTGLHDRATALQDILKENLGNESIINTAVTNKLITQIQQEGAAFITQTQTNFTTKTDILKAAIAQNIQNKKTNRNSTKDAILEQIEQVKVAITGYLDNLRTSMQKHKALTNYLQQANQQNITAVLGNNYATKLNSINISKYQTTFKNALKGINIALQNHVNDESLPISS